MTELTVSQKLIGSIKHDPNKPLTWKNFSFKKALVGNEWSYFFYWVVIMALIFLYKKDTSQCMYLVENMEQACSSYCFSFGK